MTTIIVRFQQPGFHRWQWAPPERSYLQAIHRHNFHFQVELQVFSTDREIELHDLLDTVKNALGLEYSQIQDRQTHNLDFGDMSCETIALWILSTVKTTYPPVLGKPTTGGVSRWCAVEVWEDGEVGARVEER